MHLPDFTAVGTLGFAGWTRGQCGIKPGAVHWLRLGHHPQNKRKEPRARGQCCIKPGAVHWLRLGHHPQNKGKEPRHCWVASQGSTSHWTHAQQLVRGAHGQRNTTLQVHQPETQRHTYAYLYGRATRMYAHAAAAPSAGTTTRNSTPLGCIPLLLLHPGVLTAPWNPRDSDACPCSHCTTTQGQQLEILRYLNACPCSQCVPGAGMTTWNPVPLTCTPLLSLHLWRQGDGQNAAGLSTDGATKRRPLARQSVLKQHQPVRPQPTSSVIRTGTTTSANLQVHICMYWEMHFSISDKFKYMQIHTRRSFTWLGYFIQLALIDTYRWYIQIHTDICNKDRYIRYSAILCRYIQIQSIQTDIYRYNLCSDKADTYR
jgi:hypothetical protein